jgi:hypothetical protein
MRGRDGWVGRWAGRTVAVIASGPSLTLEDVTKIRDAAFPTIVTNTTWEIAPWADVLFAYDLRWWTKYLEKVRAANFRGDLVTCSRLARKYDLEPLVDVGWFHTFSQSGASAISLAITTRARRVILLGCDCKPSKDGAKHWHGDHPHELSNAASLKLWPPLFKRVAKHARDNGVEVINCTRDTALECFPRISLEEALKT